MILRLDTRSHVILNQLLCASDYLSINDLVRNTKQSRRTVYYSMNKINNWLELQKLPRIETERNRGVFIPSVQREVIRTALEQSAKESPGYTYSPLERVRLIICLIIQCCTPIFIENLCELCEVSRNTVLGDLKTVTAKLQKYGLELTFEGKRGYIISGDVIRKRALFLFYFNYLTPLFESGIPKFMNRNQVEEYYETLHTAESMLETKYVTGTLLALSILLSSMVQNRDSHVLRDVDEGEIITSREFKVVRQLFPQLIETEQCYLALHLLGSRLQSVPVRMLKLEEDNAVYEMAVELVRELERKACVQLEGKQELERALFAHLMTSLYRYRYGIQLGNPFAEDIMREYPNLFQITRSAVQQLEKQIGLPILDGEVAYLTMHFGGFLRSVSRYNTQMRILIVCPNGISTGNMLRGEVKSLLPNAKIVDVIASADIINVKGVCDLVVSTVAVRSEVPTVVVHPILTNEDRMAILRKGMRGMMSPAGDYVELEPLFHLVSKYVQSEHHSKLREDLVQYLHNRKSFDEQFLPRSNSPALLELLDVGRVKIVEEKLDWREAIEQSCSPLLERGSFGKPYVERILLSLEMYGYYMFIAPGLMLAHARPQEDNQRLDISVTLFRQPVCFDEDHEAAVIFVLAPVDTEQHLRLLKDIITIFSVHANVAALAACATPQQALALLQSRLCEAES